MRRVQALLEEFDGLRAERAELTELLGLAEGEALAAECRAALAALEERLRALPGEAPREYAEREALVTVTADPGESERRAYELWQDYLERARRAGRPASTYDRRMGEWDVRSVTMRIGGPGAFGWLAGEDGSRPSGPGVRVEVLPMALSFDPVRVPDEDVRVEEFPRLRGCGVPDPGGNRAVRITHLPTGTVVVCEDQGTTHRNRVGAMAVLRTRLLHARTRRDAPAPSRPENASRPDSGTP
ncbi:PCRF domain-containing protein [Actinomadura namibiensis]|uniref:PCRF domain-containing protein n=1 Tax=Actinomadura kijaniata TaxID=46161 RepID=UPI001C71DBFD|nr:PCRF domain-containing protein [Actinomadura namibiensis]